MSDANPTGDPLVEKPRPGLVARGGPVRRPALHRCADGHLRINLWTGFALLLTSAIFVAWALIRPLSQELEDGA